MILKDVFNALLAEGVKEIIRNRFRSLFIWYDKQLYYHSYCKAVRYILHKSVLESDAKNYEYRYDEFLSQIKNKYIQTKIQYNNLQCRDEEMHKCYEYVIKNGANVYCGLLDNISCFSENDVFYDDVNELFYGMYYGKKLYFSSDINDKRVALNMLNGLAAEQSEHSPHKYLSDNFQINEGDVVFDIGCADGNFALSIIEKVSKVYLFEVEEKWIKPLTLTFADYNDKVVIEKKLVGKTTNGDYVSVDDYCKKNGISKISLLKMDVEGYENDVLEGARTMIGHGDIKKMAICTYHNQDDEARFSDKLKMYDIEMSEGYMLGSMIYDIWKIKPPYIAKAVMRATIK